jgi:ankyrin repeat protein
LYVCQPDALDHDGKTPLFKSAKYNQYFAAQLLLEQQAQVLNLN